jgi:hypothetical protein
MSLRALLPAATAAAPAAPAILSTLAAVAPPVLAGLAIGGFVRWLLEAAKEPETAAPAPQIPALESTRGNPRPVARRARRVPTCARAHRAVTPVRVLDLPAPALSVSSLGNPEAPAPAPATVPTLPPAPEAKLPERFIRKLTADKVASALSNGPLSRQQAVAALVAAGASRSRAYEALRADGAFAAHLDFQPDGKLAWKA